MKSTLLLIAVLTVGGLTSCSGGATSNVEISVTSSLRFAIPAEGTTCYARKSAADSGIAAVPDVQAAYFTIPKVTFKVADPTRNTYISAIKVYYTPPGGEMKTCALGGDQLAALKTGWWGSKVALISANAADADKVTDCAIICGEISVDAQNFTSSGTIKVYGYTTDPNNEDDSVGFTATTFFNYGSQY